jgi:hypothetical protein
MPDSTNVLSSSSLYPQPVAPTTPNLLADPTKILGLVGQLNQNALFQQQFSARKAIGQAYQDAIRPDGSIDTQTLKLSLGSRTGPTGALRPRSARSRTCGDGVERASIAGSNDGNERAGSPKAEQLAVAG